MNKLLLVFLFIFSGHVLAQQTDTLFILETTDVHGNIYPYNYFTDEKDDNIGLAKIYSRVIEYRLKHKNVILVDCGDLLQGTPLTYYFNNNEHYLINPMILTLNYMGYDVFTVGNHDIEMGPPVYLKARSESSFPWLSANSFLEDGRTFFKPYTIVTRGDLKIGFLGLTTPGIPLWLDKTLYPGIEWKDMVQVAHKFAAELKKKSDLMIGLFHAGFNEDYSKAQSDAAGIPNENASRLVAEQVPGFDAVIAGHSHHAGPMQVGKENEMIFKQGPAMINAGSHGRNLAILKIIVSKDKISGWKVIQKSGWIESMKNVEPSQAILDLTKDFHLTTLKYIRTKVGETTGALSAKESRLKDTAMMELINKAQMDYCGADISFAASFNTTFELQKGDIKVKDIYNMYYYENDLYMMEMTGQQIKDYLEYSARIFQLDNGKITLDKKIVGYNYDMAEGINYTIDVSKPVGQRITRLTNPDGSYFDLAKKYKVALNSYRATGGGGHLAAAGADKNPIIFKSGKNIRYILTDYISKLGTITPTVNNNWKLEY